MSIKIKNIEITAFRGIHYLELPLDGKSLLLKGENGTGKSSIVEALELFFTGGVQSLKGIEGLSLQNHGPHVHYRPSDVNIHIQFDPGNILLNRTFSENPQPPESFKDYFNIASNGIFILRRTQILNFIISQPAQRFNALADIIGVRPLDEIELDMKRVRDDFKGIIDSKITAMNRILEELSHTLNFDVKKEDDALKGLNNYLKNNNLPILPSLTETEKHTEDMLKKVKQADAKNKFKMQLNEILILVNTNPFDIKETLSVLEDVNIHLKRLIKEDTVNNINISKLIEKGYEIIERNELDHCPLCQQSVNRTNVLRNIKKRLKTYSDLSDEASETRKISTTLSNNFHQVLSSIQTLISKFSSLDDYKIEKDNLEEYIINIEKDIISIKEIEQYEKTISIKDIDIHIKIINQLWQRIKEKVNKYIYATLVSEEDKKIIESVKIIQIIKSKIEELTTLKIQLKELKSKYLIAATIYSTFSNTKKNKMQEIYDSIEDYIQEYYSILHPNEPHGNIQLRVVPGRRASTNLMMDSFNKPEQDPRALASEGHLDSLGLCIFLGFVRKFNDDCSLIALDDVVSTVDSTHRERICNLLHDEFADKQLVITTHDGIWYEQLRASQIANKIENRFINNEIIDWSVQTGPRLRKHKMRWERIQEKLNSNDKYGAGNESRQYLEHILSQICEGLEVAIPLKNSGRYDVSDYFHPFLSRCKGLIKDEKFNKDVMDKITKLQKTMYMGNLLSHSNEISDNVGINEVKSFSEAVHNLHLTFLCPNCSKEVKYFKSLGILRCSNKKCTKPVEYQTH